MTLPDNSVELEMLMQNIWLFVTPPTLAIAALVLLVRFVEQRRWTVRMSRATLLLVLSYATLMIRLWARSQDYGWGGDSIPGGAPDAAWAAFYVFAALYFFYALMRDWVIPFVLGVVFRVNGWDDDKEIEDVEVLDNA